MGGTRETMINTNSQGKLPIGRDLGVLERIMLTWFLGKYMKA
jgi:hypothetical protein